MKIVLFNGSPKPANSNTMQLTHVFLEGVCEKTPAEIELIEINKLHIKPCIGCFACWNKTPGKCCLDDDMAGILTKILEADCIIWSFPLYYFSIPSGLKALIDRQLPMMLPFMAAENNEGGAHLSRYDLSGKKHMVISTCGFYSAKGNYDGVSFLFDKMLGTGNYDSIYCGQGELFRVPELKQRTGEYLGFVKTAGAEFAEGMISVRTKELLSQLLYPKEVFEQMADASWNIEKAGEAAGQSAKALSFTKQMAALYNKSTYSGKDKILEMHYTDCQERYQLVLTKDGNKVLTEDFLPFTTKIETPLSVWQSIAKGELDGQAALMERLYRVEGDFDMMLNWDSYFGSAKTDTAQDKVTTKKSNMNLLIVPWLSIWFLMDVNSTLSAVIAILCSVLLPFAYLKWKPTVYECISVISITVIALLSLFGTASLLLVPLSYFLFGLLWTATVFLKIPLTASYSMHEYGAEKALSNPLFIRTNRILTACWGVLYLLTPTWTYVLMTTSFSWAIGIVNSALPILLGVFTMWFQKWYPAYYAAKS